MARYSKESGNEVRKEMEKMKKGQLNIGKSNKKVKNPKQAIAIGLSEARRKGKKVPRKPTKKTLNTGKGRKNKKTK